MSGALTLFLVSNAIALLLIAGSVYAIGGNVQAAYIGWLTSVALSASWEACKARHAAEKQS